MPCYTPLKGYRAINGGFTSDYKSSMGIPLTVPCGQCIGCRLEYARRWAIRCMHESQLHDHSYFATLTYSPENLPENSSLNKEHLTLFWKRYRKKYDKIRYYASGEYGDTTFRPHYHALIFGHRLPDLIHYSDSHSGALYTSPSLDSLWGLGNCMIGDVTFESASYVARYTAKKITGEEGKAYYALRGIIPPYAVMSRRPGIGGAWFDKFNTDVYPHDEIVVRGLYTTTPPRYYDEQLKKLDIEIYNTIKAARLEKQSKKDIDETRDSRQWVKLQIAQRNLQNKKTII